MKKQTEESWGIILWTLIIFGILFGVLMIFALYSTSNYIGLGSALQLSICHPMLSDAQCIGQEKAEIISNLQNDGRDTHGTQIFYGNREMDIPNHELSHELYKEAIKGGNFYSPQA